MPTDRRADAATAGVGATALATGGVMRHRTVEGLAEKPKVHLLGVLRSGTKKQKRTFLAGSLLGLAGTAPLAVGTTRALTGKEELIKREDDLHRRRSLLEEGMRGSAQALRGRGESALQPVPAQVRGAQLGIAAGTGLAGSALTRAAMKGGGKHAVAPVVGALAATASLPLTNKAVAHQGYEVTAYGVRRAKKAPKKPSSQAFRDRPSPRSFREDLAKRSSYLGAETDPLAQRAAITAASHPPIVGPLTAAAAAGRYAPPGQERKHALRQYGLGSLAPVGVGVAGAYAGAAAADRSKKAENLARSTMATKDKVEGKLRSAVGLGEKVHSPNSLANRAKARGMASGPGRRLMGSNPARFGARGVGAAAGFLGAKAVAGTIGAQTAITMQQRDQDDYNAKTGLVRKLDMTRPERRDLASTKNRSAYLSAAGGTAGLTSLALMAAKKKDAALWAATLGAGIGGTNALLNTKIQRKEAQALAPEKRAVNLAKMAFKPWTGTRHAYHPSHGKVRILESDGDRLMVLGRADEKRVVGRSELSFRKEPPRREGPRRIAPQPVGPQPPEQLDLFGKRDSLEIKHKTEHPKLLASYGDKGPLPKGLDRETKMKAYEARYVAHGGDRADKYGRRADKAEAVRNVGLAGATVGGAAWLAARGKKLGPKIATHISPRTKHHADTAAVGAATLGGAAELYGEYARGRRASYTNSPAGVAGSALRRMRDYTPD